MSQGQGHITVATDDNSVTVVGFVDHKILDEANITSIGDELTTLVESQPSIKLLLNFSNVQHLSSAALGMLITLNKRVQKERGQLRLTEIKPQIFDVFKITKLDKLFSIHPTQAEALENF